MIQFKPWHGYVWVVAGNITGILGAISLVNTGNAPTSIGIVAGGIIEIMFGVFILVKTGEI